MRPAASALLALLLVVAGCTGAPERPATTPGTPATTTTPNTTVEDRGNLSADRAKRLALEREKGYLSVRLRNHSYVDEWGVGGGVGTKEARIVNRTADGYVVEVRYPDWYNHETTDGTTTRTLHADAISEAVYVVRVAANGSVEVRRRSGTEVV
jgi:hypothetical protein